MLKETKSSLFAVAKPCLSQEYHRVTEFGFQFPSKSFVYIPREETEQKIQKISVALHVGAVGNKTR